MVVGLAGGGFTLAIEPIGLMSANSYLDQTDTQSQTKADN